MLEKFDKFLAANSEPGRALVIGGNHDKYLETLTPKELKECMPHATILNDDTIELCGLKIFGSGKSR